MAANGFPSSAKEDPDRFPPSPSPPSTGNPNSASSPNRSPKSGPAAIELFTPPPDLPNLPPSLDPPPPSLPPSTTSASSRRFPPPCWTHEETLALIDCYREKWYALRRGNLRASHWQEVAYAVGRRCQHLIAVSATKPKTSVQCRHKVEKLRKRYRAEKQRALRANPPARSWVYFRKMDAMELGTSAPTAAATPAPSGGPRPKAVPPSYSSDASSPDDDDEDEDADYRNGGNGGGDPNNTRNVHGPMFKANGEGDGGALMIGGLKFKIPRAVRSERANIPNSNPKPNPSNGFFRGFPGGPRPSVVEETRKRAENRRRRKARAGDLVGKMVEAVEMLGDGFTRMEEMKMEMAREMEKLRMEMEMKRTEMILESQRQIVDAFVRGLRGKKRAKLVTE